MKKIALFLIVAFVLSSLISCLPDSPEVEAKKKLARLREIKKEDGTRMKRLKKAASLYKLRGKSSRTATKEFLEELISYLDFLIETAPGVRSDLNWFERNNLPASVRLSNYLAGGKSIIEREKNARKGIWDVRMYKKRKKNYEMRLKKKEAVSQRAIFNIKFPL